jgi:D-glycero-D-manno-heptose 1,7-bisphosphate phosphatase
MKPSRQKARLPVTLEKVIFLDRDGVINYDSPDYIKSWEEYRFLPGSLEALAALTAAGHALILITNQSIIGRGMVPLQVLEDMHQRMRQAVAEAGGRIFDIFYCPHRPEEACDCRKPAPGMIVQAASQHHIDPAAAIMIGDNAKDIACGRNAGCGLKAEKELALKGIQPTAVADDLANAAEMILSGRFALKGSKTA